MSKAEKKETSKAGAVILLKAAGIETSDSQK